MAKQNVSSGNPGSAAPDFHALLSKPMDSFSRPVSVPGGNYFGTITKTRFGKSRFNREKPALIIELALTGPTEDVPAEEMEGIDISKVHLNAEYEISSERMYIFNDFLESLGHDTVGKPADEFIHLLPGAAVIVTVTATASDNGKDRYNNVRKVVGA